jgi:hypothetical protein
MSLASENRGVAGSIPALAIAFPLEAARFRARADNREPLEVAMMLHFVSRIDT